MLASILHENEDWMPPLRRALERARVPHEEWLLLDGSFDLDAPPPAALYLNRMSPSAHTRGNRLSVAFTRELLVWLESHGRRVINGSHAFALEISKVRQYAALRAAGIETPRTIPVAGDARRLRESAARLAAPFVVKHNRGGMGSGVRKFDSHQDFAAYVDSPEYSAPAGHVTLLQEFVQADAPRVTRLEFVGGELLYAMDVDTSEGFELCPAGTCSADAVLCPLGGAPADLFSLRPGFDHPIVDRYRAFLRANAIDVAGIEFIESADGRLLTYDVNGTTNYAPVIAERHGIDGNEAIADLVGRELRRGAALVA